jgi:uncharacterized protein with HEPN domain
MAYHDPIQCVIDAVEACRLIQEYTAGITLASYQADRMRRDATEREFEILGEAFSRIEAFDDTLRDVVVPEMGKAIGMRHHIAHGYDKVKDDVVLDTAINKIPPLLAKLEAWLEANG